MSLDPRTIVVFLDAGAAGRKRAWHAASLAQRWRSHLIGIHPVTAADYSPSSTFALGHRAMSEVADHKRQADADAAHAATRLQEYFHAMCDELEVSDEFHPLSPGHHRLDEILAIVLHSDLVVVGQPEPCGMPESLPVDKLLLWSSSPVLILPDAWEGGKIGRRSLVGWNATREARRAIADAMPFLATAQAVDVLTIDPSGPPDHGETTAAGVAQQLQRHGIPAEYAHVASDGAPVSRVLLDHARRQGSDLLIAGAYSHTRVREKLFGGTTQALLAHTTLPTLLSR